MLSSLKKLVTDSMAVDLGTATTLIAVKGRGVVLDEPSLVAINERTEDIVAYGQEAADMSGREGRDITVIDLGMDVQQAGDAPRVRHLGSPDPGDGQELPPGVFLESQIGPETRAALKARGHTIIDAAQDVGGYQAIIWDAAHRTWWGGSEMRKDGAAMGY